MTADVKHKPYVPGMYAKKRPNAADLANQYIREWEQHRLALIRKKQESERVTNCICISRQIGIGALQMADMVAEKKGFRVVDREILERIAEDADLHKSTVEFFDEKYPGKMNEFGAYLFGEKSFVMSDYMRRLSSAVYAIADAGTTIFVGRGAHLILPRARVLAVRFISKREYRIQRIAQIMDVPEDVAQQIIEDEDRRQNEFFKKNFGDETAAPEEFDLIINCSYMAEPQSSAALVVLAYDQRFEAAQ